MLFHTWPFLIFFLVCYSGFLALRKSRFRIHWLLAASYLFYGWWNPLYLPLILFSTLIDYVAVIQMDRTRRRKLWLWISLINNLGLLAFFKYAGFLTENINAVLAGVGSGLTIGEPADVVWMFGAGLANDLYASLGFSFRVPLKTVLPVGISFYTFQSMSYTIDFYRGRIERERSFVRFAAFVSLFPQLVAGPIERASSLLPQLAFPTRIRLQDFTDGLSLFLVGLFKKLALANYLAMYVDRIYAAPGQYNALALLLATFAFAWQIYFDFSGYTDMARGVGRAMGFHFTFNFNNPYLATGLSDFWGRWHISLSTWFRDYVYVPLGGNRNGRFALYRNLFLTFFISGFWHGAAWTLVIWGTLHATGTVLTHACERSDWYRERVPRWLKRTTVFLFVCFAWIFFRAESLADAWLILSRIATTPWGDPQFPLLAAALILAVWGYQFLYETQAREWLKRPAVKIAIAVLMILYLFLIPGSPDKPFIYFQF
ncbi:MAG: MBOAT family protein [Planctomycetes bacterium]|nr:MBOAT family protein [Planctomycetota bacterium]